MITAGLINVLFAILKSAIALFVVWVMLRIFDEALELCFKDDVLPKLKEGNVGIGIYFGLRFLGAALLGGLTYLVPL